MITINGRSSTVLNQNAFMLPDEISSRNILTRHLARFRRQSTTHENVRSPQSGSKSRYALRRSSLAVAPRKVHVLSQVPFQIGKQVILCVDGLIEPGGRDDDTRERAEILAFRRAFRSSRATQHLAI